MRGYSEEHLMSIYMACSQGNTLKTGKFIYRLFQTGDNTFELHRKRRNDNDHKSECILRITRNPA